MQIQTPPFGGLHSDTLYLGPTLLIHPNTHSHVCVWVWHTALWRSDHPRSRQSLEEICVFDIAEIASLRLRSGNQATRKKIQRKKRSKEVSLRYNSGVGAAIISAQPLPAWIEQMSLISARLLSCIFLRSYWKVDKGGLG